MSSQPPVRGTSIPFHAAGGEGELVSVSLSIQQHSSVGISIGKHRPVHPGFILPPIPTSGGRDGPEPPQRGSPRPAQGREHLHREQFVRP